MSHGSPSFLAIGPKLLASVTGLRSSASEYLPVIVRHSIHIINMNKDKITFDSMPEAVSYLIEIVEKLIDKVSLLNNLQSEETVIENEWLTLEQLREYLPEHPAKQTIYQWVSQRIIPAHKKTKKLYFQKSEIDEWMADNSRKTQTQLEAEAKAFIATKIGNL